MSTAANCIFCQILAGQADASFVYRDERVAAFMDLFPVTPGHTLVVPISHHEHFSQVDPACAGRMFELGRAVGAALLRTDLGEGVSYFLAEGELAGQVVPHAHLHVIPRFAGDHCALRLHQGPVPRAGRDALERSAYALRDALETSPQSSSRDG